MHSLFWHVGQMYLTCPMERGLGFFFLAGFRFFYTGEIAILSKQACVIRQRAYFPRSFPSCRHTSPLYS